MPVRLWVPTDTGRHAVQAPFALNLRRDRRMSAASRRAAGLLGYMRELVRKQLLTCRGVGRVLARVENDVVADRVSLRVHHAGRFGRLLIGVYANRPEIVSLREG